MMFKEKGILLSCLTMHLLIFSHYSVLSFTRSIFTGASSSRTLGPVCCWLRDVGWSPSFQAALITNAMLSSARITSFLRVSNTPLICLQFLLSHWNGFYKHLSTVDRFLLMVTRSMIIGVRIHDLGQNA